MSTCIPMFSVMRNSFIYSMTPQSTHLCIGRDYDIDRQYSSLPPVSLRQGDTVVKSLPLVNLKVILLEIETTQSPVGFIERRCLRSTSTEYPGVGYRN